MKNRMGPFVAHPTSIAVLALLTLSCDGSSGAGTEEGRGATGGLHGAGASGGHGGGSGAVAGSGGSDANGGTAGNGGTAEPVRFLVLVRNTSSPDASVDVVFGPGVFLVHSGTPPWFEPGQAASPGLEHLAEDGMVNLALSEAEARSGVLAGFYGVDELAVSYDESPLLSGTTADFEFVASPGDHLEFGMMWSQSNDVFVATQPGGIALFDGAQPHTGLATAQMGLFDAGTEVNQPPGAGDAQGPRQPEPDYGTTEGGTIAAITGDVDASGFTYPSLDTTLEVEITIAPAP